MTSENCLKNQTIFARFSDKKIPNMDRALLYQTGLFVFSIFAVLFVFTHDQFKGGPGGVEMIAENW